MSLPTDFHWNSATQITQLIASQETTATEVLEAFLTAIESNNPTVNAIVTLDVERAYSQASRVDRAIESGEVVGPLAGLPWAAKDLKNTAGMRTTFGSPIFKDYVPTSNDLVIDRLIQSDALLIGKTNTPEFGAGSHTFNKVFGATRNPYDITKSAGGSSGGAAAALASGMLPIADRSDTGGSLRNPASFCNVIGFRPSPGRVPHTGSCLWQTLSVTGPMARTVDDIALLFSAMAGPDPRYPFGLETPGAQFSSLIGQDPMDIHNLKVAYSADFGGLIEVEPEVHKALEHAVSVFSDLGAQVTEISPDFSGADEAFRMERSLIFDTAYGHLVDTRRDEIKQSFIWNVEQGRSLTEPAIVHALQARDRLLKKIGTFFLDYDCLITPSAQVLPFDINNEYPAAINGHQQETYLDWMRVAYFISDSSVPSISMPAGFSKSGLPIGIQIISGFRKDAEVLHIAKAFESVTHYADQHPIAQ
jgi:amidase